MRLPQLKDTSLRLQFETTKEAVEDHGLARIAKDDGTPNETDVKKCDTVEGVMICQ
jgi:hypothetical protein